MVDRHTPGRKKIAAATSALIGGMADSLPGTRVTVERLQQTMEGRGLGLVLLILSLPVCIPNIPGISTIFGLLLIAPAFQIMFGHKKLWLPGFVRRWSFKGGDLRKALVATSKIMKKVELLARPRLTFLATPPFTILIGLQVLLMALILLLPMPGANFLPGISVALTGIALLQRDGLFMFLSIVFAAITCAWVYYGGKYVIEWSIKLYESAVSYIESLICSFMADGAATCLTLPWMT